MGMLIIAFMQDDVRDLLFLRQVLIMMCLLAYEEGYDGSEDFACFGKHEGF